jgi:hypothetical protein
VKKAELKAGVAYYATSRNNQMYTFHSSVLKTHKQHQHNRYYVIFESDGQPKTGYRSPSVIFMTNCPTYGMDCPTHKIEDNERIHCWRTDFRLMDIRGEYWSLIKDMHQKRKNEKTKDIRAERLRRIAKRNQEKQEEPIKAEFYSVLSQIIDGHCVSWDRLGEFSVEEMQKITNALKATLPTLTAVAS